MDQMEGKGSVRGVCVRDRPAAAAIVRGVRMPMRMRGTRHARYLQTPLQIHSYADILYCSHIPTQNMLMQLLRRP